MSSSSSLNPQQQQKKPVIPVDCPIKAKTWKVLSTKTFNSYSDNLTGSSEFFTCKLMQVNLGNNNNKFYIIQVLEDNDNRGFLLWTRWGRVGYDGQTAEIRFQKSARTEAITAFKKKFYEKTRNEWDARANFSPV